MTEPREKSVTPNKAPYSELPREEKIRKRSPRDHSDEILAKKLKTRDHEALDVTKDAVIEATEDK